MIRNRNQKIIASLYVQALGLWPNQRLSFIMNYV